MEVVSYRMRAEVRVPQYQPHDLGPHPSLSQSEGERDNPATAPAEEARKGTRQARFSGESGPAETPIWQRDGLRPDDALNGPAIIEQIDATTVVPPGWLSRRQAR